MALVGNTLEADAGRHGLTHTELVVIQEEQKIAQSSPYGSMVYDAQR